MDATAKACGEFLKREKKDTPPEEKQE